LTKGEGRGVGASVKKKKRGVYLVDFKARKGLENS